LISAVQSHSYFIGIKNDSSQIEAHNCQKVVDYQIGSLIESIDDLQAIVHELVKEGIPAETEQSLNLHHDLLVEASMSDANLDYWLMYVHKFGAAHLIPEYKQS